MYFDRFDIVIAYYVFYMLHHEGQGSYKYKRLCRILRYFSPSPLFSVEYFLGSSPEYDNARAIYGRLARLDEQGSYKYKRLCRILREGGES